jgi:hypothetical protein
MGYGLRVMSNNWLQPVGRRLAELQNAQVSDTTGGDKNYQSWTTKNNNQTN